ncbi:MAG: hypothetical protein MJ180_02270 [Candidatus Gastranaerophilales bacterium]|nr:hypothetical protein [Candidatus Gastranaerophilales bacterium]
MDKVVLDFLEKRELKISTNTKARGHLGFYCNDKITLSKNLPEEKQMSVLLHEFAHKIHSEIEPNYYQKGGSLEKLFQTDDVEVFEKELLKVTEFVDENSKCLNLENMKSEYKEKVQFYEELIKQEFPDFVKSKKFKEYEKYQRKNKCKSKYFLKYDHIKIYTPWLFKNEFYSIEKIDEDFPELPLVFKNYFYLLSNYRKQKKVQNKIATLKRYYKKPTELFARFVEGLAKDREITEILAPNVCKQFYSLALEGYYNDLPEFLKIINDFNL